VVVNIAATLVGRCYGFGLVVGKACRMNDRQDGVRVSAHREFNRTASPLRKDPRPSTHPSTRSPPILLLWQHR
jgi:hypothetical protein